MTSSPFSDTYWLPLKLQHTSSLKTNIYATEQKISGRKYMSETFSTEHTTDICDYIWFAEWNGGYGFSKGWVAIGLSHIGFQMQYRDNRHECKSREHSPSFY